MATNVETPALVLREAAAEILGVSVRSVDRLRERGRLAAVQYLDGGHVRYRRSDVIALSEPEHREPHRARANELDWH